jgi:hypothetical protein
MKATGSAGGLRKCAIKHLAREAIILRDARAILPPDEKSPQPNVDPAVSRSTTQQKSESFAPQLKPIL